MDPFWTVVGIVTALLVALTVVYAVHDRRAALGRMTLLAVETGWKVAPPRAGRNQAGPGLQGRLPGDRAVELYFGEAGGGLFRRWTMVEVPLHVPPSFHLFVRHRHEGSPHVRAGEILTGDGAFDQTYRIRGDPAAWTKLALPAAVRAPLLQADNLWHLSVKKGVLHLAWDGWEEDPGRVKRLTDLARLAAEAAESAAGHGRQA